MIPNPGDGECSPWLVDRIFRHILVDLTGNTHRAEFCIDKLYSPDSASGRLGLLELRGFEMPPDARMSLTQQLLVRALVAWFWKEPYMQQPTAWGTQLHDRFMLPHFTSRDFDDVLDDLKRAGYPLEAEWFAPHFEFRYPALGRAYHAGVTLELRQATEPWYVLGEEGAAGAMARYVDSSVERVQVKVEGLTSSRHIVTCNGRRLPLHFTGRQVGVRRRSQIPRVAAGILPASDHPRAHALDLRSGRYLGGTLRGRMRVSRVSSGWPYFRDLPGLGRPRTSYQDVHKSPRVLVPFRIGRHAGDADKSPQQIDRIQVLAYVAALHRALHQGPNRFPDLCVGSFEQLRGTSGERMQSRGNNLLGRDIVDE